MNNSSFTLPEQLAPSVATGSVSPCSSSAATADRDGSVPAPGSVNRRSSSHIARTLTLTEIRKAAWARIYRQGVVTGDATFSTQKIPCWKDFDALMVKRHRYIAADPKDNRTLGWISCFRPFPALSYPAQDDADGEGDTVLDGARGGDVLELLVFVADNERGKGVGSVLLKSILQSIETDLRVSTVQASFFPENRPAQSLFEQNGFSRVASRPNVGRMQDGPQKGRWRDLVIMEKKLPDRVPTTDPAISNDQSATQLSPFTFDLTSTTSNLDPMPSEVTINPHALLKRPRIE